MKTLKLFNAVPECHAIYDYPIIDEANGLIIEPKATIYEKEISEFYSSERLKGNDLNKTFHKSWKIIQDSSYFELLIEQVKHYISTYGSDFKDEIYIPNEILDIENLNLKFKVIKTYTNEEMIQKCLKLLQSGIAMKQETIEDILEVLEDMKYSFTGNEEINNKEARIIIADRFNILPKDNVELLRYIVYKATGTSLLIKNKEMIDSIKYSSYDPKDVLKCYDLKKLSEIFNRFKPLFLAFKNKSKETRKYINKISKYSKEYHKPLKENIINLVTVRDIKNVDLSNVTLYNIFKAYNALNSRIYGQSNFLYIIRNGKSFIKTKESKLPYFCVDNLEILRNEIVNRLSHLKGKTILLDENIDLALPTSEKDYIGNIPCGTKFFGEQLCVGVYWKNVWGANDLDLSSIDATGYKVGWNTSYKSNELLYSGDITNAPNGAMEYLYCNSKRNTNSYIIKNNIYSGEVGCKFKLVIGNGDNINYKFMMNPENLIFEGETICIQREMLIGYLDTGDNYFQVLNMGTGGKSVSRNNTDLLSAVIGSYQHRLMLKELLMLYVGCRVVYDIPKDMKEVTDLRIDSLEKDSLVKLFEK